MISKESQTPQTAGQNSGGFVRFRIRALSRADMPQIADLLRSREDLDDEGARRRTQLFEWIAFGNPFADSDDTYYVAEHGGRIIAHHGRIPTLFSVAGIPMRGFYVHDLYVHPEYRLRGMGFWITMAFARAIENESGSFFCLVGMTPLNRMMQRKRMYLELFVDTYVRPMQFRNTPRSLFGKITPLTVAGIIPRFMLRIVDLIILRDDGNNVRMTRCYRFDDRFDDLFKRVAGKLGVCTWKSARYLNWKYVERPYSKASIFTAETGDALIGFVVVSSSPYGAILELIADPDKEQVIMALCKTAVQFLREQGVEAIRCTMSDDRFAKVLRKLLFFKVANNKALMIGNLHRVESVRESLVDIKKWYLTLGESDAFMLSP